MAYTDNHCDLNQIEDKPIAGFTKRQLISFAIIAAFGTPTYIVMYTHKIDTTISCLVLCFIAVPIFMLGTYKDNTGRPLEKIIGAKIRLMFLANSKRPYATNNSFDALKRQRKLEVECERILNKGKNRAATNQKPKKIRAPKTKKKVEEKAC